MKTWLFFNSVSANPKRSLFQRPHHITKHLLRIGDRVIWYEEPPSWIGAILKSDWKIIPLALSSSYHLMYPQGDGETKIETVNPRGLYLIPRTFLQYKLKSRLEERKYSQLEGLSFKPDICVISKIFSKNVMDLLRVKYTNSLFIFDLVDDFPEFLPGNKKFKEDFLCILDKVDGVVSVKRSLLAKYSNRINSPSCVIPNGVGFNLPPAFAIRNDEIKKVGFYGALTNWFDWEKWYNVAAKLPGVSFLLAGSVDGAHKKLLKHLTVLPNVKYIGPLPYKEVPNFLSQIDTLWVNFKLNERVLQSDPIKIKEGLYAGIPVIVPFNLEDENLNKYIIRAEKQNEILEAIMNPGVGVQKRLEVAKYVSETYSWESLTKKFREFCLSLNA